ncbi:hypothetical protein C1645_873012 [Glomus cerebriforme]|uniref:SAM domain-containing protein n=1 Tax=Glomus cerebriforme TaxID=658196 RepID=A0A397T9W2_9GLOM|nr:hypothetical protein C1645_873012 [Glomus cerebriforme]
MMDKVPDSFPAALLPVPAQLDRWTSLDVFRYFKSKAIPLSILDKELNIFIEERITGKHLIDINIHILKVAGFSIGSSMNILNEIKRLKHAYYGTLANKTDATDIDISEIVNNTKEILKLFEDMLLQLNGIALKRKTSSLF